MHTQRSAVERRRHGCGMSTFAVVPGQGVGWREVQGGTYRTCSLSYGNWWAIMYLTVFFCVWLWTGGTISGPCVIIARGLQWVILLWPPMTKNHKFHVDLVAGQFCYFPVSQSALLLRNKQILHKRARKASLPNNSWQVFLFPCVALEIGADLPSNHVIDRWLGEPIKAAILPTSIFLTNKKGFPVLSKMHQRLIFRLLKVGGGRVLKVLQLILLPYFHMCDIDTSFHLRLTLFLSGFWRTIMAKLEGLEKKKADGSRSPRNI